MGLSHLPEIERLHLADVTMPVGHPLAGQAGSVDAFVILHAEGSLLVDTGVGVGHPGIERLYRPRRRQLADALATIGLRLADIVAVVNTHLHFDHCGENRLFPSTPIFVQAKEYEAAHQGAYTVLEWVDFSESMYELVEGEAEVLPGVSVVATPGHTPGHQSVLIAADEGRAVIAGQAAYTAEEYAQAEHAPAESAKDAWNGAHYIESLRRLRELSPDRVYFSHDATVWKPGGNE